MSDCSLPRRAEKILAALGADPTFRNDVLGDLAEEHALRVHWHGAAAARRWYYRESLRVAPWLLRSWWRSLKLKGVCYLAGAVAVSSLLVFALDEVLKILYSATLKGHVMLYVELPLMLLWTLGDGVFGGYIAARFGKLAQLPGALALGCLLAAVIMIDGYDVPLWFRIPNAAMCLGGAVAGGLFAAWRTGARRAASG